MKQLKERFFKAQTLNISGGGVAFENQKLQLPLQKNDIIELTIAFPDKSIVIEAEVLNTYSFDKTDKLSFGVRFVQHNIDRRTFKMAVNYILRYVMRRERELLSRR